MFSFLYASLLLLYCLYTLFKRDRNYYVNLDALLKEYKKLQDSNTLKKFAGPILCMAFFSFTELIFYANLALHKIIHPYSAMVFFAHLFWMIISMIKKKEILFSARELIFSKIFISTEIVFLSCYLYSRVF